MTAIFTNKTDLTPSATQSPTGAVSLTASGTFDGAGLVIEARAETQAWVTAYRFDGPGIVTLDFVTGHEWRAFIDKKGASTSVSLAALAA